MLLAPSEGTGMVAVWLPGGVTHLRFTDFGPALCGRRFVDTCADSNDHTFPQPQGLVRSERYCRRCKRAAEVQIDRETREQRALSFQAWRCLLSAHGDPPFTATPVDGGDWDPWLELRRAGLIVLDVHLWDFEPKGKRFVAQLRRLAAGLPADALDHMEHALGREKRYRNWFVADRGGTDHNTWTVIEARGLATSRASQSRPGASVFFVEPIGEAVLLLHGRGPQ